VGKSSLLNRILGRDRAIVTHLPGTTRDTLEEPAHIRGIPVSLVDTAGIRDTVDLVERTGVQRTYASIREAQVLLWIVDAADSDTWQRPPRDAGLGPVITVINKRDLTGSEAQERCLRALGTESVPVSALTGEGIDALFDAVEQAVWRSPHTEAPAVAVNARHAGLLREALDALHATRACMARGEWETAAVCIRDVQDAVGRVLGRTVAPDVLDRIFGRFCIGK
jgi:tRNA modification GTPase